MKDVFLFSAQLVPSKETAVKEKSFDINTGAKHARATSEDDENRCGRVGHNKDPCMEGVLNHEEMALVSEDGTRFGATSSVLGTNKSHLNRPLKENLSGVQKGTIGEGQMGSDDLGNAVVGHPPPQLVDVSSANDLGMTPRANYDCISHSFPCLGENETVELCKAISEEDVHSGLFRIVRPKAPRPDGFPAIFFENQWNICNEDLIKFMAYSF
ncbi:hypothetical protein QYF36_012741 [Acer negundo]|nr:hypothetical protein QYF36_012741 [Acer negundo]